MISKLLLTGLVSTGVIGGAAAGGLTPTSLEIAAGPVRIESSEGNPLQARMANQSRSGLIVKLQNGRRIIIRFS